MSGDKRERERVIADAIKKFHWIGHESVEMVTAFAWDAALDAAAKCAFNDEPELDILALKGDCNVAGS